MIDEAAGSSFCLPPGIPIREIVEPSAWTTTCPVKLAGIIRPVQSHCGTTSLKKGDRLEVGQDIDKKFFVRVTRDGDSTPFLDAHGSSVDMSPYLGTIDEKHVQWLKARDAQNRHTFYVRIIDAGLGKKPFGKYYLVTDFFDDDGAACMQEMRDEESLPSWEEGKCGSFDRQNSVDQESFLRALYALLPNTKEGGVGTGGEHKPNSSTGQCPQ